MTSSIQSRLGTAPEEGCKAPVKVVATTPITLSGEQTISTVAVVAGDRVLVNGQADTTENGIYNVSTTAWTYAKDWNKANDVIAGMLAPVSELSQLYQLNPFSGDYVAGTTAVTFTVLPATSTTGITHTDDLVDYDLATFINDLLPTKTELAEIGVRTFDSVDLMVAYTGHAVDNKYSTGGTRWKVTTSSFKSVDLGGGLYAIPLNGVWVDDLIADRTLDSTAAFNEAILINRKIRLTEGDYFVNDIDIKSETSIEGPLLAFFYCNVANAAVFLANTDAGGVTNIRLKGFSARVSGALTGCAFYRQTSMTYYTEYSQFEDIETFKDFLTSYDMYPIYCTWTNGRDGFQGNFLGGQTHQALRCIPDDYAQARTTNANTMYNFKAFGSSHSDGAFSIQQGFNWNFIGCSWEKNLTTRAVHLLGIIGVNFIGCYFESNGADEQIFASVTTGINAQGTRPVVVKGCHVRMDLTALRFITFGSGSRGSVTSTTFTDLNTPGVVMTNTSLEEAYDIEAVSGTENAAFAASVEALRNNITLSSSEFTTDIINSPQSGNANMLPIGPSGLGSTNFSVSNFTGLTDVATSLGGAGQAVQVTISGSGNAIWFTVPAKLRAFLEGKTVTWSLLGFGDVTASPTAGVSAVWEGVTPLFANTTSTGTGITSNQAQLQQGTLTHTIGTGLSSLHFGFVMGGLAGSKPLVFEAMQLMLGEIKPEGLGLV